MKQLVMPLRLRSLTSDEHDRKVTWLELFFDLLFVAAVAQVAAPLHQAFTVDGLIRFTPLFVLVWWAWTGHAVFCTRFDTDDAVQRGLTLVQMFVIAVMAANAKDALDSRSSAGFAAAYAGVRVVLVAQYFRARHIPEARGLTTRYLGGPGTAAMLWLASGVVPAPARFWVWGLAFAIDLGTPWHPEMLIRAAQARLATGLLEALLTELEFNAMSVGDGSLVPPPSARQHNGDNETLPALHAFTSSSSPS